jgi:8-amino-7-oxononanoate synthase
MSEHNQGSFNSGCTLLFGPLMSLDDKLQQRISERKSRNLWRTQRVIEPEEEPLVFCSNDYLGVATRQLLPKSSSPRAFGAAASRLISGTTPTHARLEKDLAEWMGTESARFFSTGYQANVGLISSLVQRNDVIFSDALNHASIIDGARLSKATIEVYSHADLDSLEEKLRQYHDVEGSKWILSDAIFSMDGDVAPIDEIVRLAERYEAHIYIDEAHAIGVLGDEGRGLVASKGQLDNVDVIVGTCGKSMGAAGAFVVGSETLCDYVYNAARSFVFSTAPPPIVCEALCASVELMRSGELQAELWENIHTFASRLREEGWWKGEPLSPIFPIVLGSEQSAVTVSEKLLARGFFVHPIRPPTVPEGTSRLRITIGAHHTTQQLADLADALVAACEESNVVPKVWSHG